MGLMVLFRRDSPGSCFYSATCVARVALIKYKGVTSEYALTSLMTGATICRSLLPGIFNYQHVFVRAPYL